MSGLFSFVCVRCAALTGLQVHDQLDSTRKAAETVEEKNLELVVTNVDLLRSVNALQQV